MAEGLMRLKPAVGRGCFRVPIYYFIIIRKEEAHLKNMRWAKGYV